MKLNKFATVIATCGLLATTGTLFTSKAFAAPPGTATASDGMKFSKTVASECSVDVRPTNHTTPEDYTIVSTPAGGTNADIDENNQATPALEERATQLTASEPVTFDCNTDTVNLTVTLTGTEPNFVNATNIEQITRLTDLDYSSTQTDVTDVATAALPNGASIKTDVNGDLQITLTSKINADNEELAAGAYTTDYTIQVVAP